MWQQTTEKLTKQHCGRQQSHLMVCNSAHRQGSHECDGEPPQSLQAAEKLRCNRTHQAEAKTENMETTCTLNGRQPVSNIVTDSVFMLCTIVITERPLSPVFCEQQLLKQRVTFVLHPARKFLLYIQPGATVNFSIMITLLFKSS